MTSVQRSLRLQISALEAQIEGLEQRIRDLDAAKKEAPQ